MSEATRLASLRSLDILDTDSEETFDCLVRMAADALGAPIALATLVDEARVWLKAKVGIDATQAPREGAFCSATIRGRELLVVEDATRDARFASSALVVVDGIRFYAGAPVTLADGEVVGAVCVLDTVPRPAPDAAGRALLKGLAAAVGHLLDLRRQLIARRLAEHRLAEQARLLEMAEEIAGLGTWRLDFATGAVQQSPPLFAIYGLEPIAGTHPAELLLDHYDAADRGRIAAAIEIARATGVGYSLDARLRRSDDGVLRDVRAKARVEVDAAGCAVALVGVLQDVTVEKEAFAFVNSRRIEADRRADRMRHLASVDALTGLPNRRAFLEEVEGALWRGECLGLAILDLDHFKSINDRHGHDIGDAALAAFGKIAARFGDEGCRLGRIGGEEFALMVFDGRDAVTLVERLRAAVLAEPVCPRPGIEIRLTFSAGLAHSLPDDEWASLFTRADRALYRAKHDGRDRLAVAA